MTFARAAPNRYQVTLWAALLTLGIFLSLRQFHSFQLGVYGDDAHYAVLARSLLQSDTYGLINVKGQPGDTHFPFGYPLVLAPWAWLYPEQLEALNIPSLLATILNACLLFWGWRWFSKGLSYWWGLAATALYLLSPLTIGHSGMVMSEPVFTTFCLASIILIERTRETDHGWPWLVLMGGCLLFAAATRAIGVALIAVAGAYLLYTRGRHVMRRLLVAAASAIVMLGMVIALTPVSLQQLAPARHVRRYIEPPPQPRYDAQIPVVSRITSGLFVYLVWQIRVTVVPLGGGSREASLVSRLGLHFLQILLGVMVVGTIAVGYWRWASTTGMSSALWFALVYLGVLIFWPWWSSRFLYPIQPQLYLGLLLGVATIASWLPSRALKGLAAPVAVIAVVLGLASIDLYKSLSIDDSRSHTGNLELRTQWVKEHTEASAVIMSEEPATDYLYSGRHTVRTPDFGSIEDCEGFLAAHQIDYVLVTPKLSWTGGPTHSNTSRRLLALLDRLAERGRVRVVHSDQQLLMVYKVETAS